MKIIIAGSRGFDDYERLCRVLSMVKEVNETCEIVSGTARGADTLGERYALEHDIKCVRYPADWEKHGKRAGILRNIQMAEYADGVIAFWDGESHGTLHMIEEMKRLRKAYLVANYKLGKITEYEGFTVCRINKPFEENN